jgi:hypothetical protein
MMQPPKPPPFASRALTDRLKQSREAPTNKSAKVPWWRRLVRFLTAD